MRFISLKTLLVLISWLTCFVASSQVVPHTKYSSKDGLIADRISTIAQDKQGMLWFGSYYGICRYNGQVFEKMPLPDQQQQKYVTAILPVSNSIYAGFLFNGGLCQFSQGQVRPLFIKTANTISYNDVSALTADGDSALIIASLGRIYQYSRQQFKLLFDLAAFKVESNSIKAIVKQPDQSLWVATSAGLFILQKNRKDYVISQHVLNDWNVFSLYKTPKGITWIEAYNSKTCILAHCKEGIGSFKVVYSNPHILKVPFSSRSSELLWAVDGQKGLFNITDQGVMSFYPETISLKSEISFIYADRENNIWIANDPGVTKIALHNARTFFFNEPAAAGGHVSILQNGDILSGNSKNLYLIKNELVAKVEDFRTPQSNGYLGSFIESKPNHFWCYRWDQGLWNFQLRGSRIVYKNYFDKVKTSPIRMDALVKAKNITWAGGFNHFYFIENELLHEVPLTGLLPSSIHVTALAVDTTHQRVFVGDNAKGIYVLSYRQAPGGNPVLSREQHFGAKQGITDTHIRSLYYDSEGSLWAGTRYGGIFRIASKGAITRVTNYNSSNGIPCTRVTGIAEEAGRSTWFSTCDGIHRYIFASRQWEHYDIADGLPSSEVFHLAVDSNEVWALTSEGVTAINYKQKVSKAPAPLVNLTGIYVLDAPDSMALYSGKTMRYRYDRNSIRFNYSGSSFIDEKKVLYKYRLKGYSPSWSAPSSSNNVTFASLPPGHYRFEVIAANSQGTWSDQPAVFSFQVVQPFYQSIWFLLATIAFGCLLFYLVQNYRLKQKVRIEKLRLNIARDLHDDIGSALGSINILSKTATRKLEKAGTREEIMGAFEKIGDSAQSTLESMDDIIWSINPEKDHWQDLLVRMKEFALPILEARNIRLEMHNNATNIDRLSMQSRRTIFLVFKECITNAVKHADCTLIRVEIAFGNGMFLLSISDNGKGFDTQESTNRNGIRNILHRAHLLEGNVRVESSPGEGTTIQFQCPLR